MSTPNRQVGAGKPQRDVAYEQLRHLILIQQIPEGTKLREIEWADRLQVNRMALREAFARLEANGLIERGAKAGYRVPTLDAESIRQIMEVRACLESGAIGLILRRQPTPSLDALEQTVVQLERLIDGGYLLGITEVDRRFHETLIDLSGNTRLSKLYERAPLPMLHNHLIGTEEWPRQCKRMLSDHRAIVEAMKNQDTQKARDILADHLDAKHLQPKR